MSAINRPLTGNDTVAVWLAHPEGGPAISALLGSFGQGSGSLDQVRNLPLNTLVTLSQGKLTQETVDGLVASVNGGALPDASAEQQVAAQRFAGQTVIITGAASGIGKATAERVLAEGGRVVAVDIAADRLEALAGSAPAGRVVAVTGDITDETDVTRIVAAAGERIDGLANFAGIMDGMLPLHEVDDAVWDRVMSINVTGAFKLSRAVLPRMLEAESGSIVNVASEAALRGNAAGTAYTVSKHALVGMTKSAAFLYGPNGIRTNAVSPGPVATGIGGDFRSEFGRKRIAPHMALIPPVTTPETLASSITWLLSGDSANVNGMVLASDGGWSVQ